jgi:predicted HTH transcriptional regulator
VAVSYAIVADPFLEQHCEPLLYEFEPASTRKAVKECLEVVQKSHIFVLIIGDQYGSVGKNGLSITHREYRQAKQSGLAILVFIRGMKDANREEGIGRLIDEIRKDGYKYKRFVLINEFQDETRKALYKVLREQHGIEPTSEQEQLGEDTIEAASQFGMRRLAHRRWTDLDLSLVRTFIGGADQVNATRMPKETLRERLRWRGLIGLDPSTGEDFVTAAALVLLGKDPAAAFPQCRILLDAYSGTQRSPTPCDSALINAPIPLAVHRAIEFVQKNTRHPIRIVGLNRVQIDEYPLEALREGLVNAVAHRNYELEGQRITVKSFPIA